MSDLTSELNLSLCVDADDTADYLTSALRDSLTTIDGLFNQATGHTHSGTHQGGLLEFLDLTVSGNLAVTGQTTLTGPLLANGNLHVTGTADVTGLSTLASLRVNGATTLVGATTLTGGISGAVTVSGLLTASAGISATTVTATTIRTSDWHRVTVSGLGIFNEAVNQGVGIDASGAFLYTGDRLVGATAIQTLSNKTLTSPTINSPAIVSPTLSGTPSVSGNMSVTGNVQAGTFNGQTLPYTYTPTCHIQSGQVDLGTVNGGQGTQTTITFPGGAFAGVPTVVVSHYYTGGQPNISVASMSVTASNFVAHVQNNSGSSSNCQIRWIAVYGSQ